MDDIDLQSNVGISDRQNASAYPDMVGRDSRFPTQLAIVDVVPVSQQSLSDDAWEYGETNDLVEGAEMAAMLRTLAGFSDQTRREAYRN